MAMLTLAKAVQETGLSKTVISKAIKSGRLPAKKGKSGAYQINAAQLKAFAKSPKDRRKPRSDGLDEAGVTALETENRALKRQVNLLKQQITDLQLDRDRWARQAEQTNNLARSSQRAMRRTNKNLAELRKDALIEAREAAERAAALAAQQAPLHHASRHEDWPPQPGQAANTDWINRFGRRSDTA